ncbi:hypothetical protein GCM10008018_51050 [Paenibacillus marchantiophytorum]|uniref:Uncharacterized protein n=1 Tax=Paenibacillus marchantiophytorum TaxID=1619310 RepID=A0ABQ1F4D0_9BACL|nr:hypothetical protein GCM10008018_51050 [Paenibacillus marchantiophytorum]
MDDARARLRGAEAKANATPYSSAEWHTALSNMDYLSEKNGYVALRDKLYKRDRILWREL